MHLFILDNNPSFAIKFDFIIWRLKYNFSSIFAIAAQLSNSLAKFGTEKIVRSFLSAKNLNPLSTTVLLLIIKSKLLSWIKSKTGFLPKITPFPLLACEKLDSNSSGAIYNKSHKNSESEISIGLLILEICSNFLNQDLIHHDYKIFFFQLILL